MKLLIIIVILISIPAFAYSSYDIVEDTLIYSTGSTEIGKVIKITETAVEFQIAVTEVNYEISKKKIKEIRLGNGRIIEFLQVIEPKEKDDAFNTWQRPKEIDEDDGGLGVWGVIGVVLTVLIVVGLLAQAGGGS